MGRGLNVTVGKSQSVDHMADAKRTASVVALAPSANFSRLINTIQCGDAESVLTTLPDDAIDLVITSPPYYKQRLYNQAAMGLGQEGVPEYYIDALLDVLRECCRVVKPTGNIVFNVGDKYIDGSLSLIPYQYAIRACKELPLRLVNDVTWVKSNPTPRQFDRRLVSSTEPFFHFAITRDYYYDRKSFCSLESDTIQNKPSPRLGKKYYDLIDNSLTLTPQQKTLAHSELERVIEEVHSNDISGFRMKIKGIHAEAFGGQGGGRKSQMDRHGFTVIRLKGEKMKRDIIESPVENLPGNNHSAIFPLTVVKEFIRMLCPPKGIVLDPYVGSGTSAVAALMEDRQYIGIDIDPEYCKSAEKRLFDTNKETL